MNIQSPELLSDLYRDLRDRRLLPVIVVLVTAIAVVPMALSKSPKSAAPAAAQPAAAVQTKSSLPAAQVVVSDPGLRDYKRRLEGDSAVDPFLPRIQGSGGGQTGTSTSVTAATSGLTQTTQSSGSDVPPTAEGQAAAQQAESQSGGTPTEPSTTSSPTTQSKFYFYRVKARAGQLGEDLKVHDSVGSLSNLPSDNVPALAFLGVTTNSSFQPKTAVFLVSSAVSSVDGEGSCTFAGTYCQLLSLKPGEHEDLVWTDGLVYRVELVKFNLIVRKNPPPVGGQNSSSGGGNGSGGDGSRGGGSRHSSGTFFSSGPYFSF
jgi:hypothetical protein